MSQNLALIQKYFTALSTGDFATVSSLLSDDLVWHQPGKGILSGTFTGKGNVLPHLGKFAELSEGTFAIDHVAYIAENNNLVAASINFKAQAKGQSLSMKGVDLFLIEDGIIREVWLFSEDSDTEDNFWTTLSAK